MRTAPILLTIVLVLFQEIIFKILKPSFSKFSNTTNAKFSNTSHLRLLNTSTLSALAENRFPSHGMKSTFPSSGVNSRVSLTSFLPWINSIRSASVKTSVYFSISDSKYSGRFEEIIERSVPLGFPNAAFAMIAFDEDTYTYFRSRNVPTLLMDDSRIPIMKRVMNAKFMGTLALLLAGYDVYFGEMDVYWRKKIPHEYFSGSNEFVVSEHNYHPEINIGFFYCRPTPRMIETMERVMSFLLFPGHAEPENIAFDQKIFDLAVRGPVESQQLTVGSLSNILNETEKELLSPLPGHHLNWRYLPYAVLSHSLHHGDGSHFDLNSETLAGVHVWSGFGPPSEQIAWALSCFTFGKLGPC